MTTEYDSLKLIADLVIEAALSDIDNLIKIFPQADEAELTREHLALTITAVTMAMMEYLKERNKNFQITDKFYEQSGPILIKKKIFEGKSQYDNYMKPRLVDYFQALKGNDKMSLSYQISKQYCLTFGSIDISDIVRISGYFDGTFKGSMKTMKSLFPDK